MCIEGGDTKLIISKCVCEWGLRGNCMLAVINNMCTEGGDTNYMHYPSKKFLSRSWQDYNVRIMPDFAPKILHDLARTTLHDLAKSYKKLGKIMHFLILPRCLAMYSQDHSRSCKIFLLG